MRTYTLQNKQGTWAFQGAGQVVYVTQTDREQHKRRRYQYRTQATYTVKQARNLWALLMQTGATKL